jgi:hypothetical protein
VGDQLLRIGFEIAVGVPHHPEAARFPDEHPVIEHFQGARQDQTIGEDRSLVHDAVVIGILEHDHVPDRVQVRFLRLQVPDEPRHLDDPQASGEIPIHDGWILNERFAGHELDVIAGRHEECLDGVGWREHRRLIRDFLYAWGPRAIRGRALKRQAGRHRETQQKSDRAQSGQQHENRPHF